MRPRPQRRVSSLQILVRHQRRHRTPRTSLKDLSHQTPDGHQHQQNRQRRQPHSHHHHQPPLQKIAPPHPLPKITPTPPPPRNRPNHPRRKVPRQQQQGHRQRRPSLSLHIQKQRHETQ